tara:strand:- start:172 stop:723 length:552 start_codon:yes stop_codon:yes gene_type:complete
MQNKDESTLIEYSIAAFLGGILTGPGGLFLSTLIFFLISRSKKDIIYKSKWALWAILGIFPFVLASYPLFVLSRTESYTKEVKRALNDQALKCRISEFESERMKSKINPGNSLYKTYIPKDQNECSIYKSKPRNFKSGFRSILFWNRDLAATWFQIELDQTTGGVQKTCGDSSKPGCNKGNNW